MHERILRSLQCTRSDLRARWETLLRQAPVSSPLADPDVLVHLMEWTLEEFFKTVIRPPQRRRLRGPHGPHQNCWPSFQCSCGSNPLEAYFSCLQQALVEAIEHLYTSEDGNSLPDCAIVTAETQLAFRLISQRELETFCSVCQHSRKLSAKPASQAAARPDKISLPILKSSWAMPA